MTIRKKLYLNVGFILGMLAVCCLATLAVVSRAQYDRALAGRATDLARTYQEVKFEVTANRLYLSNFLLSGKPEDLKKLYANFNLLLDKLNLAEAGAGTEEQRAAIRKLRDNESGWMEQSAKPLIGKKNKVRLAEIEGAVAGQPSLFLEQDREKWIGVSNFLLATAEAVNRRELEKGRNASERASLLVIGIAGIDALAVSGLALVLIFALSRSIVLPLEQLTANIRRIGDAGDLERNLFDLDRPDEIGGLARAVSGVLSYLKEMTAASEAIVRGDLSPAMWPRSSRDVLGHALARLAAGIRALVGDVRECALQLTAASQQVAGVSEKSAQIGTQAITAVEQAGGTVNEITAVVRSMVKNSQLQASSVREASAFIERLVASAQRAAQSSQTLLETSAHFRGELRNGITSLGNMTEGFGHIQASLRSSGEVLDALQRHAGDVGKIVDVLDDLTEQSILLGLNGTIEAARAGEQGLGFAAVSGEIRKLADKSAESAREMSQLVLRIQQDARKAVENTERSTVMVREGLALEDALDGVLKNFSRMVADVHQSAREIGVASDEQSQTSSQAVRAATRLQEVLQETNSSVEEHTSGTQVVIQAMQRTQELVQQSNAASAQLAELAERMLKTSRTLLKTVDYFKLESAEAGLGKSSASSQVAPAAAN